MTLMDKIKNSVYTIAEMSANHAGDIGNALKIVHAAKESGADCLKIQTYTADSLTIDCSNEYFQIKDGGLWDGYALYDLYKKAATPYDWQPMIKAECDKIGIDFLSTPFDEAGADFLEDMGVEAYKTASFELVHIPLIKHIAKKGKPMIVSCGMGSESDIMDAIDAMLGEGLSKEQIILLKCTSEYPAHFEDMNLLTIPDMERKFGCTVGFSDHSMGSAAAVTAVALGARLVEKHFCLSRAIKNPDSDFSVEPHEFSAMVNDVNAAFRARGKISYEPSEREGASTVFRRSLFAVSDIKKGEPFTAQNVRAIRPGFGIKPKFLDDVLRMKAARSIKRGMPLCNELLDGKLGDDAGLKYNRKNEDFESKRLAFREICLADSDNIVRWRSDPDIYRHFHNSKPLTLKSHLNWYENSYLKSSGRIDFIITEKDSSEDIGTCNVKDMYGKSCEIGYAIGEISSQGKGYATETVEALIKEISQKGVKIFYASVHRDNTASIRVLEKNGFIFKENIGDNFSLFELDK
jgi:pseudaminic acid synthase